MNLRYYQQQLNTDIYNGWGTGRNVLAVLGTGLGKTICFTKILQDHVGVSFAIAHRQELVGQMSLTLAKRKIKHNIIAPNNTIRNICRLHTEETGNCFFSPNAHCYVAGVNTLVRRAKQLKNICNQASLWIIDEGHHVLQRNMWGKAVEMFPNARGLGVTATALRADGHGLGSHHDGVFDVMIEGPLMRDMINQGFLTDYRIFAPASDLDLDPVNITSSGEYNKKQLTRQVRKSHIIGDIVQHYIRIAPGKLGITFVTDVKTAEDVANQYNAAGVPAVALSAKTPDRERIISLRRFRNKEILQLVNVDLFSEGFDLPAIEVVSMGRPTQSYGWYVQAFGRALRPMDGKSHAIIIDHVGNVMRHGLPDAPHVWSLDRRERRKKNDATVLVSCCPNCTGVYERFLSQCPYCGFKAKPLSRSRLEHVDGDLLELDVATLLKMRGEVKKINRTPLEVKNSMLYGGASDVVANSVAKNHRLQQEAQNVLRDTIRKWADVRRNTGQADSQSYKEFWLTYGIDVLTAQTLKRVETEKLIKKLREQK